MGNYGTSPLLGQLPLSVHHGDEEQGRTWNPACGLSSGALVGSLRLAPVDGCVHSLSCTQLEEMAGFDFTVWRKRYLQWISHRKSRVLDIFRSIDRGQDGRITQQEFVGRVLASSECRSGAAFLQGTTDVGWVPSVGISREAQVSCASPLQGPPPRPLQCVCFPSWTLVDMAGDAGGEVGLLHCFLSSPEFPTSLPEMKAVAKIFDVNRDGFIDYYEFISALHPSRDILHRAANVDHIQEEVGEPRCPPPIHTLVQFDTRAAALEAPRFCPREAFRHFL